MIVSQKYQDLLQPNSRDCFSKILRTFYASRKSWIVVVFLLRTLKEKLPIFLINTLLLHIPLLAFTDKQNYRGTELQRNELILVGLGNLRFLQVNPGWAGHPDGFLQVNYLLHTRCTWAGGTFFLVVLLCQFLVLAGNRFWFYLLCTYVLRVQYHTVVVLG